MGDRPAGLAGPLPNFEMLGTALPGDVLQGRGWVPITESLGRCCGVAEARRRLPGSQRKPGSRRRSPPAPTARKLPAGPSRAWAQIRQPTRRLVLRTPGVGSAAGLALDRGCSRTVLLRAWSHGVTVANELIPVTVELRENRSLSTSRPLRLRLARLPKAQRRVQWWGCPRVRGHRPALPRRRRVGG